MAVFPMTFIRGFNPRTYIRYDIPFLFGIYLPTGFNPRTYIRYDYKFSNTSHSFSGFQSTYLYKVRQDLKIA